MNKVAPLSAAIIAYCLSGCVEPEIPEIEYDPSVLYGKNWISECTIQTRDNGETVGVINTLSFTEDSYRSNFSEYNSTCTELISTSLYPANSAYWDAATNTNEGYEIWNITYSTYGLTPIDETTVSYYYDPSSETLYKATNATVNFDDSYTSP